MSAQRKGDLMSNIVKSDKELIERYQDGDVHSFELLIGRYQNVQHSEKRQRAD